jgi:L-asparaginase II
MGGAIDLIEVWRGGRLECLHQGHAAVADAAGNLIAVWGDPATVVYPRSSFKMIQALPLIESGAADAFGLRSEHLALACASHIGAAYHTERVTAWLSGIGLGDDAFRCGAHEPSDRAARDALIRSGDKPCQYHNNCSGKHSGFLTLNRHLGGGPEYIAEDHPVQKAVLEAFEEVTGEASPGYGIDGCSAPSHATTIAAMARGMAQFAEAGTRGGVRARAQERLIAAMVTHPELVSGERMACTELMRATGGRVAIKGGADGFYAAILPERGLGVALKVMDGSERAKEAAISQILIRLGVLDAGHPAARVGVPIRNWRGTVVGDVRAAAPLTGGAI